MLELGVLRLLALPLCWLSTSFAAPHTAENAKWNVNFERNHIPEDYYGEWVDHKYHPSPGDWRSLAIYQLLTDRFADGDPSNNELYRSGFDVRDMTFRHGGDFVGLRKKLPYIKGLGCQAIWISPVFQNGNNSYHQYAQHDFTILDRRLGTVEELRELVSAAHEIGLYVLIDVVMNHMGNELYFEGYADKAAPFRFHANEEYKLVPRRKTAQLYDTPAGKQPYVDFWYNNTWDPNAHYDGIVYGQWGEASPDNGVGTYSGSDFHHNGDLKDYFDPWEINIAKIYGTMDDLRLEHDRVLTKYIAMTNALIATTDIDGFRVDTPMQVPLRFFKKWAPAVREFAASIGKERFGIFGEFYVSPERYATMTGRGKDQTMYEDPNLFIKGGSTLKGGIVYSYYWYMICAFTQKLPNFIDGIPLAYQEENSMLDRFDPTTNRTEYSMWNFCNNHDNWRLQSLKGVDYLKACLTVITFWPGIPLHYAGDEQNFATPGSALDGWAREELSPSLAWSAVRGEQKANTVEGDNFDMTSPMYLFIQRLNALRRAYFGDFGSEACDIIEAPEKPDKPTDPYALPPGVLAFQRGCTEEDRVLVIANYDEEEGKEGVLVRTHWAGGTMLSDVAPEGNRTLHVTGNSDVLVSLEPLEVLVLVEGKPKALPPTILAVTPGHGSLLRVSNSDEEENRSIAVSLTFDRAMDPSVVATMTLNGEPLVNASCGESETLDEAECNCSKIVATVQLRDLEDGFHYLALEAGAQAQDSQTIPWAFESTFQVAREASVLADRGIHTQRGLICGDMTQLCHRAPGADMFRVQNVGEDWTEWMTFNGSQTEWVALPGVPVLVQYHAQGSSAYIVGDCLREGQHWCFVSYHSDMYLKGSFNDWGEKESTQMSLVDDYTWGAVVSVSGFMQTKFAPFLESWDKSYGVHPKHELLFNIPSYDKRSQHFQADPILSGSEASRSWMVEQDLWIANQGMASGAEFAEPLWLSDACTAQAPQCPPDEKKSLEWQCWSCEHGASTDGCYEYATQDSSRGACGLCSCCRRYKVSQLWGQRRDCCVLFNDLTLNYTITNDLDKCQQNTLDEAWLFGNGTCPRDPNAPSLDYYVGETLAVLATNLSIAQATFEDKGLQRMPSPQSWDTQSLYTVTIDRFANGNLLNDRVNLPKFQWNEINDNTPYSIARWKHGGDLAGLKGRLSYLQTLGVTTVVLSPIFETMENSYKGDCISDPTRIDPGLGDQKLLEELIQEAHERGLYIVLDIVLGHICLEDVAYDRFPGTDEVEKCVESLHSQYWNSTQGGSQYDFHRLPAIEKSEILPLALRHEHFFARCGPRDFYRPGGREVSELDKDDEEEAKLIHASKLWTDPRIESVFKFNTLNPGVQRVQSNLYSQWLARFDIDGFRILDVEEISADFVSYFSTSVRDYAAHLGKRNFLIFGDLEITSDPFAVHLLGRGRPSGEKVPLPDQDVYNLIDQCSISDALNPPWPLLTAVSPLIQSRHLREVVTGEYDPTDWYQDPIWLAEAESSDALMKSHANVFAGITGLEHKDKPPLLSHLGGSMASDAWRVEIGLLWTFTTPGIPLLTSGTEFALNGLCFSNSREKAALKTSLVEGGVEDSIAESLLDECNYGEREVDPGWWKQDMFSNGPMVLGSASDGGASNVQLRPTLAAANAPHWCEDPILNRKSSTYRLTRALHRIRRSCPVLREDTLLTAQALPAFTGQIAYWKLNNKNDFEFGASDSLLVMLNVRPRPTLVDIEYFLPPEVAAVVRDGDTFVDLLDPSRKMAVSDRTGIMSLVSSRHLSAARVEIWALNTSVQQDGAQDWLVCRAAAIKLEPLPEDICEGPGAQMVLTYGGFSVALAVMALATLANWRSSIYLAIVRKSSTPYSPEASLRVHPQHVLTAAVEHTIPDRGVKVSAGGLGKVLDQMLREHPEGCLSLVHPMFGDVDYGDLELFKILEVVVDGKVESVKVFHLASDYGKISRKWYLCAHPLFTDRSRRAPYPSPMTKLAVLRYFSLWNQCVAELLQELQPDVYHCMDYHAALAPLYIPREQQIPTILVLHNADYMGIIETDFINDRFWSTVPAMRRLSVLFNLKQSTLRKYCTFEGRFNMLKAGIQFIQETQAGRGVCAVSANYGQELMRERTLFKGLPYILPLDNATDPADDLGAASIEELQASRLEAKTKLQKHCSLIEDPAAKILIFIGRWVKQKGVDHIAMITPLLLQSHPEVQIVLAGPPDDACGLYAQELLVPVVPKFEGRLFVCTEFFALPNDLRRGAHLCLAPSCSEPFGYVDVEFGLLGVPSVGCAVGGLGKMPGIYFRQQNSDSSRMLLEAFLCAVDHALRLPEGLYWGMAEAATKAAFPFDTWRTNLLEAYSQAMHGFKRLRQEEELSLRDVWAGAARVEAIGKTLAHRKEKRFRTVSDARMVAQQMQILDIDDDREFLIQTVSEERVHDIMREAMAQQARRGNRKLKDAETLQRNICLAEQKLTERNHMTQWLMKRFLRTKYLRIHAAIATCYIISPAGETLLRTVQTTKSGDFELSDGTQHVIFYGSVAIGSVFWLVLSRGMPPNLLMAYSQLAAVLFSVVVPSMPEELFQQEGATAAFLALNGVLCASRLLFVIWNFNEDFHGGFQVACKRIGILESIRTAFGMCSVVLNYSGAEFVHRQVVLIISLVTALFLFKAPHCYCAYSLPPTGMLEGLLGRRSFWLLLGSEVLNSAANYSSQTYDEWYTLNGWTTGDIVFFSLSVMICSLIILPILFGLLTRMSVWGPWGMRDFTCLIPPGGLVRALALYDIGQLHHRSKAFAAALVVSYCIDVVRGASIFASLMTILGNKWYALKGCYLAIALTAVSSCLSPFIGDLIATRLCNSSIFDRTSLQGGLGEAVFWAVVPLASAAYLLQLVTLFFFNSDIRTFKGHGALLPDGSCMPGETSQERVSVFALRRLRRYTATMTASCTERSNSTGSTGSSEDKHAEEGRMAGNDWHDEFVDFDVPFERPGCSPKGAPPALLRRQISRGARSYIGSATASENVSEIEQTILFNLAERAGVSSKLPSCSSARKSNVDRDERRQPPSIGLASRDVVFERQFATPPPSVSEGSGSSEHAGSDAESSVPEVDEVAKFGQVCTV